MAQRNQPFANGVFGEAGDAVDVELAHDAPAMGFDGADAHVEAAGNLLVAQPLGDLDEHFPPRAVSWPAAFPPTPSTI